MPGPPYRALRVVLGFLSLFMAIGGVVLIFSSKALILRLFRHPPEAEISTLFLFTLKEMGGFALMLAVMAFSPRATLCAIWRSSTLSRSACAYLPLRPSYLIGCWTSKESILGTSFGAGR
jgi:hypothetical protein